jgi:hypothetical protein
MPPIGQPESIESTPWDFTSQSFENLPELFNSQDEGHTLGPYHNNGPTDMGYTVPSEIHSDQNAPK